MMRLKIAAVVVLAVAPFIFLIGTGSYHLYRSGWGFIAWWPMFGCLTLAYGLGWYWTRRGAAIMPKTTHASPPTYWTPRDQEAWKIVEARANATTRITPEELADSERYAKDANAMALAIAQLYSPGAVDPFGHLTIPEILTCGELVAHDLSKRVSSYIPGSHIFSVNHLKQARQALDWGQRAWNVSWLARMAIDPVQVGAQFLAAKAGGSVLDKIGSNVMLWFHTAYVHELGRYLIELNSGRLKVGAKRYLELMAEHQAPPQPADAAPSTPTPTETKPPAAITLTLIGQVKAGKSSLVNALLGERRAETDVVPVVAGSTRYALVLPGLPALTVLDTSGYGAGGPNEAEFLAAVEAAAQSDVVLLVANARGAARQADVQLLDKLNAYFAAKPQLKLPPVLGVLTHADALSPAMEWAPPYDWLKGTRPKELQMREATAAATETFGKRIVGAVPVCTAEGREFNVRDGLTPLVAGILDDARGGGLLRIFDTEGNSNQGRKAIDQLLNAGREALKIIWQNVNRPAN